MLAGAVAMGFAAFEDPALLASPVFDKIWASLIIGGIAMEAGAIAGALTSNRGTNISTRQAAAFRQIIYGEQRVGGVMVYESTTGGHHDQYNYVIVLAGHPCESIVNLYLDGRQVFWTANNIDGNSTRPDGTNFGGAAAGGTHIGPSGAHYDFGTLVYCEAYYGDQTSSPNTTPGGGYSTGLYANDPTWAPSGGKTPYLGGCTYVYLKVEYDAAMFPNAPEIRFTVRGKNNIFDPRTSTSGYSTNWALVVADVLTDTQFGLGDVGSVNQAQLIAAANVCDEQVTLAGGATESRYACHWHYDTSTDPGNVLETMMPAGMGRLSRIGGQWFIWPAYWQGPSFTFDEGDLTGSITWNPNRSLRDLFNRVNGTYIAPNYPYNVAGNLYDSNSWYDGTLSNTFPFAFQPDSYPQYACDPSHGYATDEYLADDGQPLPMQVVQSCVLSITQAQRCAKIKLLRNRQQGSGNFPMHLWAWEMQPTDVMQFTFPAMGWTEKTFEIVSTNLTIEPASTDGEGQQVPSVRVSFGVVETSPSVYAWSVADELTIYDVPASPSSVPHTPVAPTAMSLTSGASTAVIGVDNVVYPRIEVQWTVPQDGLVTLVQIQYQPVTSPIGPWLDAGLVDVGSTLAFIAGVIAGQQYNVRIRSIRGVSGAVSLWEEIDGYTVAVTLSVYTQLALAPGTLIGQALSDGTAEIIVSPFDSIFGQLTVSCLPAGPYTIYGLNQGQLYFVYYLDPAFAGGGITPIATQNQADYLNKVGYFLIDSIITPLYTSGAPGPSESGTVYRPSNYADNGSRTTTTPAAAYDGNRSTAAVISGVYAWETGAPPASASGNCVFAGFPGVTVAASTLVIFAAPSNSSPGAIPCEIVATIGSTTTTVLSTASTSPGAQYTLAIAAGTNLAGLMVIGAVIASDYEGAPDTPGSPRVYTASLAISEMYVVVN